MRDYRVVGLCVILIAWALFLCCCTGSQGNEAKNCTGDFDCMDESSVCADGVDPYHVCSDGKCANLTFIQNPCLASHVCPKGNWINSDNNSCFTYANCAETGCDDGSDTTIDVCVNIGSRSEGCRYIIKTERACVSDSDCVPEQCCHPTTCINREYRESCTGIMCTAMCQGPIDCGAGGCACVNNECVVQSKAEK